MAAAPFLIKTIVDCFIVGWTGKTKVESINQCALCMKFILKHDHDKDQFDSENDNSIFQGNIEQFFGNINYNKEYKYHLCETDILLNPHTITTFKLLERYAHDTVDRIHEDGEEIDQMSEIVTIRFLVKKKKRIIVRRTNKCITQ